MPGYFLFNAGVSAMHAQSRSFDTISSNIANANTTGYKDRAVRFEDLVGGRRQGGLGETLSGVNPFQQTFIDRDGVISGTNRDLDGALAGSGFFVTRTTADASGDIELTDAGSFDRAVVEQGGEERAFLTDAKGNFLLGYNADPQTGQIAVNTDSTAALEPIDVTPGANLFPANPTTSMDIGGNLPAGATAGDNFDFQFSVLDGTGSADGTRDERAIDLTFTKTATPNEWNMTIAATDGTVTAPTVQPVPVTFDNTGRLSTVGGTSTTSQNFSVDWTGPAVTTPISLDLADMTQFAGAAQIAEARVDGNIDGALRDVFFNTDGQVVGAFSNGRERPIAQLALGDVVSPNRMDLVGETHFATNADSGDLQLYDFATSDRVDFVPAALEASTVDFAQQFSDLIITQRAYSSAATTLRTVDEMTQVAAQLK